MTQPVNILQHCRRFPVVPVLSFTDAKNAVDLCGALLDGGVAVLEITFRTPAAVTAIEAVANAYPQAVIAAGSARTPTQLQQARDAGATFAVCPGFTPTLLTTDILPLLPAASTAAEVMQINEYGINFIKFFPAVAAGGVAMLKAFYGPLADVVFCPTGGITPNNAGDFLSLPNVACVGGSWLVTPTDTPNNVYKRAQQAALLSTK